MASLVFTYAPGSWISRLIVWFTRSRVSHVGIGFGEKIYSAEASGVECQGLGDFLGSDRRVVVEMVGSDSLVDSERLLGLVGAPYDVLGLAGDVVPTLSWRWFHLRLRNLFASRRAMTCAELVVRTIRIPEFVGLDPETVSPGEIQDALLNGPSFRVKEVTQ